ncbi:AraC family transcriptional regulator [Bacillus sp. CGMCC 1.16607]|uniref:AraC family transcriptional regulator n=1 Tax=Bacillus sp. CGMCC 1.16607 TaxID=3351842 RepID=UPI00362E18B9
MIETDPLIFYTYVKEALKLWIIRGDKVRYLNLKLKNSKFMMTHLKPHSSDPVEHDHGEDFQITIPILGDPSLLLNNQSNQLHKNIRMITQPGEKHLHFTGENESRILLININKRFLEKVLFSRIRNSITVVDFSNYKEGSSDKLIKIADEAISNNLYNEDDLVRMEELEWELAETLLAIHEGSHSEQWRKEVLLNEHPTIKKVIEYILENYQTEISLDALSAESNLSKFYLIRAFKEIIGCTPSQYIMNIRLEKAMDLLLSTRLDITTICYEVGFGSLNTFERVFKKRMGCTISEFRRRHTS